MQKRYEEAIKEKQDAIHENERATVSFAVHFDQEISVLNNQIETLTQERNKARIGVSDLGIKLENTKYELNRLQREHIKLQLEQEKYLDREEKLEDETIALKEELGKLKKNWKEDVMDRKKTEQVCKVCLLCYTITLEE